MSNAKGKTPNVNKETKQNGGQPNKQNNVRTQNSRRGSRKGRSESMTQQPSSQPNSRENSKDRESNESEWTCDKCSEVFQSDNSRILECEYCNTHRCIKCLNISITCYNSLSGRNDFPWFCEHCLAKTLTCIKEAKSIEERCNDFLQHFEEKVSQKIESVEIELKQEIQKLRTEIQKVDDKQEIEKLRVEIEKVNTSQKFDVHSESKNNDKTISEAAKEVQSRVDRKNNIVLYNLPECESNIKDDVIRHDNQMFSDLCHEISVTFQNDDIVSMRRVGKKNKGEDTENRTPKPRPVLVSLTEQTKPKVMRNVYKLRNAKMPFSEVSVKHDMTKEERDHEKELRTEAKRLNNENKNSNFQYVVRGMPWERQVRKIKTRTLDTNKETEEVLEEGLPQI